jgi:hypothetical protein
MYQQRYDMAECGSRPPGGIRTADGRRAGPERPSRLGGIPPVSVAVAIANPGRRHA